MKLIILLLLTTNIYAFKNKGKSGFYKYKHDSCSTKGAATKVKNPYYHCKDGTVSFQQPGSLKYKGYEGKCGQTAASNVMYMYCGIITDPIKYGDDYLSDYTPGVRPDTMKYGLNEMFSDESSKCPWGIWKYYYAQNRWDYFDSLVSGLNEHPVVKRTRENGTKIWRSPIPVLIEVPPKKSGIFHWVTVVDIINYDKNNGSSIDDPKCQIYFNHWDDQYKMQCDKFANLSRNVDYSTAGTFTGKYVRVKFKKLPTWQEMYEQNMELLKN